jgi:hypothetical protein
MMPNLFNKTYWYAPEMVCIYKVKNALIEKKIDNKARCLDEKVCGRY